MLGEVELPFLREAGFEVFVPACLPDNDDKPSNITISKKDYALLNDFDFFGNYFSPEIIDAVNRNFQIAMAELNQYSSDSLVSFFPGVIFIREMGYGIEFGKQRKIEELFPPASNFWASFYENRERIFLISVLNNIPQYLADVFVGHSMWLPPLFPFRYQTPGKNKEIKRNAVLFSCPEILSCPESSGKYQSLRKLLDNIPYSVAGTQSIDCEDSYRTIGNCSNETESAIYRESAVYFDPSREASVIDRATIKALMYNTPVIFMKNGFLSILESAKPLPGCCSSLGEARRKIKRIIDGDATFRKYVLNSQEALKKNFHVDFNKYYYFNLLFPRLEKTLKLPTKPKRIGIMMQQPYIGGGTLNAFKQLIQMFLRLEVDISIGITDEYLDTSKPVYKLDIVDEIRKIVPLPVPIKTFRRQDFMPEFQMNYNTFFRTGRRQQPDILLNDGINYFQECDEFIFISDRTETAGRITGKPYSVVVYDYLQRYVDKNFIPEDYEKKFMDFVRNAKRVFVTTRTTKQDIVSYVGYPADKVVVLPFELSFREIENYLSEPATKHNDGYSIKKKKKKTEKESVKAKKTASRKYILWACNSSEHKNQLRIIQAFQKFLRDSNLKHVLVISGVLTDRLDPDNDEFMEYPNVKDFKLFLRKNPQIRKQVFFAGEMPRHAFLTTMKNADAVLLSSVYDNGAYAAMESACFRVPCISARYPAMEELVKYLGIKPSWYDPYDVDSIAAALEYALTNRKALSKKLPELEKMKALDFENMTGKFKAAMHGVIN